MNGLDAMALAIMRYEGNNLDNLSFRNCNPGNLRASSLALGKDAHGYCWFPNFTVGYLALLRELHFKFTGQGTSGLTPHDSLLKFFRVYAPMRDNNSPDHYASFVALFISRIIKLSNGVDSPLTDIWTPEKGLPWDSLPNLSPKH